MSSGRQRLVLAAEVLLGATTLAAVLGMSRLFAGGGWLGPIAANAVAAHLVATALRRRGLSLPVAAAVMVPAAGLVISWTCYWSTTRAGIPTSTTWTTARADLSQAWTLYQRVVAPTPAEAGFVVATALGVWLVAYVADWAAFRLWVPFEATLPAGTLFLFTALLGTARGQSWSVALFAAGVVSFLLLHRLARQAGSVHWVAGRELPGWRSLLTAGGLLGAVAVAAGVILGPSLPGADATPIVELGMGDPPSTVPSPFVDVAAILTDQSAAEMFRVRSTAPAYWRLTSLDHYSDGLWTSSSTYADADGELPVAEEAVLATESVQQTFTITGMGGIWLPAAFVPRSFDPVTDAAARFNEGSATLITDSDTVGVNGFVYEITSEAPRVALADVEGAVGELPAEIVDRYLELPADFSPRVRALAQDITSGAATPFEAARRLQDHLRQLTYDPEVRLDLSDDAMESFLFDVQRGFCQQFASSYAAMARAVGIPSRVAVGFTQGDSDPTQPDTYVVRGEHAHAWPEVYLAGAGWVSFEPTPGRGQPYTESYTGVAPAQATTGDPTSAETLPPTTTIPIPSADGAGQRPVQGDVDTVGGGTTDPTPAERSGGGLPDRIRVGLTTALVVAAGLLTAYAAGFPLWLAVRRRWRRRAAVSPLERITLAWDEAADAARMVGYAEHRSRTPAERARLLAAVVPEAEDAAHRLGRLTEEAVYADGEADDLAAEVAEESSAELQVAIRAAAPLRARLSHWLDPRPHLRSRRLRRRARQRSITTTVRADLEAERELVGSTDR